MKDSEYYYQSALTLKLPVTRVPEIDGFELYLGGKRYFFRGAVVPLNDGCSTEISLNKYCTNKLLEKAGLPVPKAKAWHVTDFEQGTVEEILSDLKFPLVIKPMKNGLRGQDVLCNVESMEKLKAYLPNYFLSYDYVLIEEFYDKLNSYRVLMFKNKVIGVVLRHPAHVVGDGLHTLLELIYLTNLQRLKTSDIHAPIVVDTEVNIRLNELGLSLEHIPKKDEWVRLCYTSNASRGGSFESQDTQICKENRRLMVRAARALNLTLVGLDIQCFDINVPIVNSSGIIIEANHNPSIRIHEESSDYMFSRLTNKIVRAFIYRHPLSYLLTRYKNRTIVTHVRAIIALLFLVVCFKLIF